MVANFNRFKGSTWFNHTSLPITVIGAGGIGSNVAVQLARINRDFIVIDADLVEAHNMSQCFFVEHVGKPKVEAINEVCKKFNPTSIVDTINSMVNKDNLSDFITPVIFSCVDNMLARRMVFMEWRNQARKSDNPEKWLFIDARLDAESFRILTITGDNTDNMLEYGRTWLFSDDEAVEPVCTNKQTPHIGTMCGTFMVGLFTNHLSNIHNTGFKRRLPFKVELDIQTCYFDKC